MLKIKLISAILAIVLMPVSAFATIIGGNVTSTGGAFVLFDPIPATLTVGNNNQQSPNLFGFNEDQNIAITSTITVNVGTDPVSGDIVASHYIFFDPEFTDTITGWVDFDADIYGIITDSTKLAASDFLANTGVNYVGSTLRGLEGGDSASIDPGMANRLLINFRAGSPGDYIRVLTMRSPGASNNIPEPSMMGLLGLGLLGVVALRRRKYI
ncbi:hypothetical protein MNBD_ALPHA02-490 [hydrothermal vent metagenome]|uniref:Ice-binding protein C-terminal domain-containing protein n=1 Tax=hydrothermal vent metagenome TaxID=652676 RepID=A0A3B0RBS0_9ZZZZ